MGDSKPGSSDQVPSDEEILKEVDEVHYALFTHIEAFADEHDVTDTALSILLLDIGIGLHMTGYVESMENPSGTGLKLALDRLRRQFEHMTRDAKKRADEYVVEAKAAVAEATRDDDAQ